VLAGFTLLAGGSLGQSNGVRAIHPRLADPIGFVPPDRLLAAAKAVVSNRDFGNRENRRLARLKYVIEAWGEVFRRELEARLESRLRPHDRWSGIALKITWGGIRNATAAGLRRARDQRARQGFRAAADSLRTARDNRTAAA